VSQTESGGPQLAAALAGMMALLVGAFLRRKELLSRFIR
jgi:hypothetical protein